jgi:hypothetical protein
LGQAMIRFHGSVSRFKSIQITETMICVPRDTLGRCPFEFRKNVFLPA